MKSLQSRFDNLQDRYDTLLTDHEKLSYEFLQRKLDLEKLRMSHDDLRMENDSLLAQQISASQVEFIPLCLKCIERKTLIPHQNHQMLLLLQILQLHLLCLFPHLRKTQMLLMKMQG